MNNRIFHTKSVDVPLLEEAFDRFGMQPTDATCNDLYNPLVTVAHAFMAALLPGAILREENALSYNTLNVSGWPQSVGRSVEIHADYDTPFARVLVEFVHENPRETYWHARLDFATLEHSLSLYGNCGTDYPPRFSIVFDENAEWLFTVMVDTLARVFDYTPLFTASRIYQ